MSSGGAWPLWSPEEVAILTDLANARTPVKDIAPLLNRTVVAVRIKRHHLGLPTASGRTYIHMTGTERSVTVAEIKRVVSEAFEIPLDAMTSMSRTRDVARPRQVAMFFAREIGRKSYPRIGAMFGGRDHTTALHARREVERLMGIDQQFKDTVTTLREQLVPANLPETEVYPRNTAEPTHNTTFVAEATGA